MKVLVAETDPTLRRLLEATLLKCGFEVAVAHDGPQAWEMLQSSYAPRLLLLDRALPGLDGIELCRKARRFLSNLPPYIILLTTRDRREDIVEGLESGADDCLGKPFDTEELKARIQAGERIVELQRALGSRQLELETVLARVEALHRLLPVCVYCRTARSGKEYLREVEAYISSNSSARSGDGTCPHCHAKIFAERTLDAKPA
jgi:DNA-binding response OmpR family regulator